MDIPQKPNRLRMVSVLIETFGLNPFVATAVVFLITGVGLFAIYWFIQSAPPHTLVLTSGPQGSSFQRYADSYARILAKNGVTLKVLPSKGSEENLKRLESAESGVDIGFVQAGLHEGIDLKELVSLGSIAHQPIWVFYRSPKTISRLSELAGQRIAVGSLGSGTHALAVTMLQANGISSGQASLLELDADAAASALLGGQIDAIFLMGDSASIQTLRSLIRSSNVQLFNFAQADAYARRYPYLSKMELPQGAIDLGKNLPPQDVVLLGPTVELIARKTLNPALSDLLLGVAQEVHGRSSFLQKKGEYPAPQEHGFTLSEDALRYYKSGKGLLYRSVQSFWLASLINRILVVFVPTLLVLIPAVRFLPVAYKWRIQLRIYRYYRALLLLERELSAPPTREQAQDLLRRVDEIDLAVNQLKVPASFADQFYGLRGHIAFVRTRLKAVV